MIILLGAACLMICCVRFLNRGHKMWVEQHTPVSKVVSVVFTITGIVAGIYSYIYLDQFVTFMGWQ